MQRPLTPRPARPGQARHRGRLVPVLVSLLACASISTAACSDDDDDTDPGSAGRGGASGGGGRGGTGPSGGTPSAGTSNLGGAPDSGGAPAEGGSGGAGAPGEGGGAGESAAGADGGRNVLRPEELPFDQDAFEALELPEGFEINVYRSGLGNARMIGVHGENVYVTRPVAGNVVRLIDADADGVAEAEEEVVDGIEMVHGIAFHEDTVFLANVKNVYRATVATDGSFSTPQVIIDDLPDGGQHPRRTLGVGPDELLYISVGSSCDACQETNPEHATILTSTLTGQDAASRNIYANGLRNTLGFDWHPLTDQLWGMDQGSDWRGDDLPPEELNAILAEQNYGWPYCFGDKQIDPIIQDPPEGTKAAFCAQTTAPVLENQAHQSPIGFRFYTGATFPERYQDGAFVALRGSWNRIPATGYKVAFIPYDNGTPTGIEDFVTGFLIEGGTATFGRPAGLNVAADGALLFTDDTNGVVYRVQYTAP